MTTTNTGRLDQRAVLIRLRVSKFGINRKDAKATKDAQDANNAAADSGEFTKHIMPKTWLDPVSKIEGEATRYLAQHSSPWADDKARIIASSTFLTVKRALDDYETGFNIEADRAAASYDIERQAARFRLGGMFNERDYPPASAIRRKFNFRVVVRQVPMADDFRVDLDDESRAAVQAAMEAANRTQLEEVRQDLKTRVREVAERIVERLTNYKPGEKGKRAESTFKDSLIQNARDLAELLPSLNILGDPEIDDLAFRLKEMSDTPAQELREDEATRKATARAAQDILDSMDGFAAAAE